MYGVCFEGFIGLQSVFMSSCFLWRHQIFVGFPRAFQCNLCFSRKVMFLFANSELLVMFCRTFSAFFRMLREFSKVV